MVCLPCIVIPVLLWVFHKYLQPFILKFWNPWGKKIEDEKNGSGPPLSVDLSTEEAQFIQTKIKENPVMLFSKTTCSYCKMAKKVLDEVGANYEIEELDKRDDTESMQDTLLKWTGTRTVPRVFVGGKCIGGGSETWSLHNQGKLVPMMKQAGASLKKDS